MSQTGNTFQAGQNEPISFDLLKGYIQGTLNDSDKSIVENAIETDPFIADAYEGLKSTKDIEKTEAIISGIQSAVNQKTEKQKQGRIFTLSPRLAIAASLIILLGITALFYYNYNNQNRSNSEQVFAENFEKYKVPEQNPLETGHAEKANDKEIKNVDSVFTGTMNGNNLQTGEDSQPGLSENKAEIDIQEDDIVFMDSESSEEIIMDMEPEEAITEKAMADSVNFKLKQPDVNDKAVNAGAESVSNYSPEPSMAVSENTAVSRSKKQGYYNNNSSISKLGKDAEQSYNEDDFLTASEKYNEILKLDPDNINALFYLGQCNLELGQAKEALQSFNKILKFQENELTEAAQWYKALALIKMNKVSKAKKELQLIIENGGGYAEKAANLLKSL